MRVFIAVLVLAAGAYSIKVGTQTGTTPPPCEPQADSCANRQDGNYPYIAASDGLLNLHYFTQCSNGNQYCQPCWPLKLEFSPECNQCLYSATDVCYTTDTWLVVPTFPCPDLCLDPTFRGNLEDPNESRHYVACWDGVTMGCVNCPFGLEYNEPWNACLYRGLHYTRPSP